jgi:EAL and modified HD-GYP domain-containing signal transduction protein
MDIYVARQPIFDRDTNLVGYELLYRTSLAENWAAGAEARTMSSDVIIHSVLNMGLERITGGSAAFLNFTSDMLVTDLYELLDPKQVVIELLETDVCDEYTIRACEKLASAGYRLALEGFASIEAIEPIAHLAQIVKVDLLAHPPENLPAMVESLTGFGLQMLAQKVETAEAYEHARDLGFHLFQGYFFARPEILANREIPLEGAGIIRVLNLLRDQSSSDEAIEEAFTTSPAISFLLLRIAGAAAHDHGGIQSITHAVRLLGRDTLHRWLSLLFVSSLVSRSDLDVERTMTAIVRARLCELLGRAIGRPDASGAHALVGLCSSLDSLLEAPLVEIIGRIDLAPDVRAALIGGCGPYANTLRLVRAYEGSDWERVALLSKALGLSTADVTDLYLQALTWAREVWRDRQWGAADGPQQSDYGMPWDDELVAHRGSR